MLLEVKGNKEYLQDFCDAFVAEVGITRPKMWASATYIPRSILMEIMTNSKPESLNCRIVFGLSCMMAVTGRFARSNFLTVGGGY